MRAQSADVCEEEGGQVVSVREAIRELEAERGQAAVQVERIDAALRALRLLQPGVAELQTLQKRGGGVSMKRKAPAAKAAKWKKRPLDPPAKASKWKGRSHGVPGKPGELVGKKPAVDPCDVCGRDDVGKSPGPGGYMRFHYAPECKLPCAGSNLAKVKDEDRADGVHSKKNCPKCSKA